MTDRYICIHGHFYQPPRENPWLEAIELQDSAAPYHDWNERINAECYAPNTASRILDGGQRILDIVSNYSHISFNFGPTLLSWMKEFAAGIYRAVLEADQQSAAKRSGHGNAIAQAYNHMIMPLANSRDKKTQVIWGIRDFERRFKRPTEGMWLPETAVDIETLEYLAEYGIRYTILAPYQARRVCKAGENNWTDVSGGKIDPTQAYLCRLPSSRTITLFFYDGPISQAVAFEHLMSRGEDFENRLLSGFNGGRAWPQIMHIATDGETYGHHQRFGDMALAYALHHIEANNLAKITNYGEYLEKHPPQYEAEIMENTSWSCFHGVERWRSNCGCNSGGHPGWTQEWRAPLRAALDWLRDELAQKYESAGTNYLKDPWEARNAYIDIILDRSKDRVNDFLSAHATRELSSEDRIATLKLLEMQRHAMLMYTSCGWFFDELSGIETVQVIQYAARAIQISHVLFNDGLEQGFIERLKAAKSNIPDHQDGEQIYYKFVKPAMVDLEKVTAHFGISSLFEDYPEDTRIYAYNIHREQFHRREAGRNRLAIGKVQVTSEITGKTDVVDFGILYFGDHIVHGGVHAMAGPEQYQSMKQQVSEAFERGSFDETIRKIDEHFGPRIYSLKDLFRDKQREILNLIIRDSLEAAENLYRQMYKQNYVLMGFLQDVDMPVPKEFITAAQLVLTSDLRNVFSSEVVDLGTLKNIVADINKWRISLDGGEVEFSIRHGKERLMNAVRSNPSDLALLEKLRDVCSTLGQLPLNLHLWAVQNIYYKMAREVYLEIAAKAKAGDEWASTWVRTFQELGALLYFNVGSVLALPAGKKTKKAA